MREPAKTAAVVFGLGVGAMVGPSLGPAAVWSGLAVAALGVALSLVGAKESDLVADSRLDHEEDAGVAGDGTTAETAVLAERRGRKRQRPDFGHLGPRVEQILELAEEQAEDMVAAARREAEAILDRAHEQAAGITGTRAPSADGDPSPHA